MTTIEFQVKAMEEFLRSFVCTFDEQDD